jgi:DNA-binding response OmpR family regulator
MTKRRKILVVDDEGDNREYLSSLLSPTYDVLCAADGEEAVRSARAEQPDLVLLDLLMPKMDGLAACESLRSHEATRHIPVVVITGSDDMERRLSAFNYGADDFLMKPFKPQELLARVASKIRRISEREVSTQYLVCGNLTLNLDSLEARIQEQVIELSVLEFKLLKYFVENVNRVMSRERILNAVWHDAVVTDRTVDTHMVSLRKKLKGFDHAFSTVYGAGYILKPASESAPESAPESGPLAEGE